MWVAYNAEEKHYSLVASEHGKLIGVDGYNQLFAYGTPARNQSEARDFRCIGIQLAHEAGYVNAVASFWIFKDNKVVEVSI